MIPVRMASSSAAALNFVARRRSMVSEKMRGSAGKTPDGGRLVRHAKLCLCGRPRAAAAAPYSAISAPAWSLRHYIEQLMSTKHRFICRPGHRET